MKWWMRQMQPLRKGSAFASAFNNSFLKWATFRGILVVPHAAAQHLGAVAALTLDYLEMFQVRGWRWVAGSWYLRGVGLEVILAVWSRQKVVKWGCSCQWSWLMLERLWDALGCRLKCSAAPCCSAAPSAQSYLCETQAHRPDSGPRAEV